MGEIEKCDAVRRESSDGSEASIEEAARFDSLCSDAIAIIDSARQSSYRAVNVAMVYSHYELGKRIVEEEQRGASRAGYGKELIARLSARLTERYGKGFSKTNLKQMRTFYVVYSQDAIGQTLSDQFSHLPKTPEGRVFPLSWSHYIKLMRIQNVGERHFYEIEAARQGWSLSELNRQYDSALYERLALSIDKEKVMSLAQEGRIVET
ncbi:MAG: DUF1016 N-terminal domain-containing protein, partial [Slackia sp.]|nr:DUF1016 N-terminal domain-containing protein [Slackia sp.]